MSKMASTLSEEEFHRMQLQLIELRTAKYELETQNKKQEREIHVLRETSDSADRELQKALKAVSKSKKAKEVELLLQENDSLQMKLISQEDEFRLQNQTLMQELSMLVAKNEELEKQLEDINTGEKVDTQTDGDVNQLHDEITRLQAQNAVLQKKVSAFQTNKEEEDNTSNEEEKGQSEAVEHTNGTLETNLKDENSKNLSKQLEELRLSLETKSEENKILKTERTKTEEKYTKEIRTLKEEIEKVSEKLRRKQESYLQLQDEKESSFKENSTRLQELQASKDRDQKYYTDQINKHQQETARCQKRLEEECAASEQSVKTLQTKMAQMQQQLNAADIIESQHMQEKSQQYESHMKELKAQVLALMQIRDDLTAQLQEAKKAGTEALEQLCSLQKDRDLQIQALQEAKQIAEKRKSMLDDLAIKYQKDCDKHREQMLAMENSYETKFTALHDRLKEEQNKNADMEKLKNIAEEQQAKVSSLEESKSWLERRLEETEGSLDKTLDENETTILELRSEHEEKLTLLKSSHSAEVETLKTTFQKEIDELKSTEESQKVTIQSHKEEIEKLKQEIKDGVNDKKIHEKKGKSVLKDLKKQLHAERKRGEKLQERLQEILTTGSHNKSIEDLLRGPDMNESWREDQSSISSWSGGGTLASYTTNHTSLSTSPHSSPQSPMTELPPLPRTDETLENDNKELLDRLAAVQQQKWNLEERVRHLETSNAAMAEDLIDKSNIIGHYVMESRTDTKSHTSPQDEKITLKKVLDLVNKTEDQGLKEMNKKLQNMLEESLTKNMHLQKNLETLSQEVVRLSDLSVERPADNGASQKTESGPVTTTTLAKSAEEVIHARDPRLQLDH